MKMKAIKNYEGFFDISKSGEVKSLERFRIGSKLGKLVRVPERIMKDRLDRKGYRTISLRKDGTIKHFLVHRLVAETYIPNPLNLPQVNHIDGVKSNCNDWNLEWMTCSDNHKHAFKLCKHDIT